jgi:pSer/pThr/pTyr-binding forkhead associated (FHA) protein
VLVDPEVRMSDSILKLNLTLKGRSIRDYTFVRETVSIGRDPQADVFIDNMGVSRKQTKILRTPDGWMVEDSGSANGTWLNGRKVERERLRDQDQITIGKFTLSVGLAADRRDAPAPAATPARPSAVMDQTTVLTRGQLATVLETSRNPENAEALELVQQSAPDTEPESGVLTTRITLVAGILLAAAAGAGLAFLLLR